MIQPQIKCEHNCKGLCNAMEIASTQEKQAILLYSQLRDQCMYPDIRVMLNELIIRQQKTLQLLEETRLSLSAKFEVLDQIQEGFDIVP